MKLIDVLRTRRRPVDARTHASAVADPGCVDASADIAAPTASPLALAEFRRRYAAGELSLERWTECSVDPASIDVSTGDPTSAEYASAVFAAWSAITGRSTYDPTKDETFELDDRDYLARPYPYSSGSNVEVANYFGAVAAAVARARTPPPATVVEYGAGWGHLAMAFASTGYDVTAVDLNTASVDLLRRRADALGVALKVAQSDFLTFDPPDPVDLIIFFESFHHCRQPFELLDRCVTQLAPDGRMLFVAEAVYDDFYAPWGVRLDGSAAFMAAQQGWLELGFRRDFFTEQLESRGFEVGWEVLPWLGAYGTVLTADRGGSKEVGP
jgi:SAM-dependent methyltransferase